jgi:hypothetical protein
VNAGIVPENSLLDTSKLVRFGNDGSHTGNTPERWFE